MRKKDPFSFLISHFDSFSGKALFSHAKARGILFGKERRLFSGLTTHPLFSPVEKDN